METRALANRSPLLAHRGAPKNIWEREEAENVLQNLVGELLPKCSIEIAVAHPRRLLGGRLITPRHCLTPAIPTPHI